MDNASTIRRSMSSRLNTERNLLAAADVPRLFARADQLEKQVARLRAAAYRLTREARRDARLKLVASD